MLPTQLTLSEIHQVTRATLAALKQLGMQGYLVGGVACQIYGTSRVPNDIDVVVLTEETQEEIKRGLVATDPRFYLVAAKTPGATYKVLWYKISSDLHLYSRRSCKVDILRTGIMDIPPVPTSRFVYRTPSDIPIMPFMPLLLLKLQAWTHHRMALKQYLVDKQHVDVRDIEQLLRIGAQMGGSVESESWLPASFVSVARTRVEGFVAKFPDTAR
ncbi:hypothetical protein HGRIS_000084 [Hohenbuehelia grisea]|uniref:Uncharacterized protein n=1 Tax=Hohenbuehelia grisea TaxID=104357 RepID=A0ABR3JQ05_9AGAR